MKLDQISQSYFAQICSDASVLNSARESYDNSWRKFVDAAELSKTQLISISTCHQL